MKVLWFANTPCSSSEKIAPDLHFGGWLKSLEEKLVENKAIELCVCFYWNKPLTPFKYKSTYYYPVYRNTGKSKIIRHIKKYFPLNNDKKEIPLLMEVINLIKPDVIHIHGTEDNFGLVQEFTKIPCFISVQGILSSCSEKYYAGIPKSIVKKHESLYSRLKYAPIFISYRDLLKKALRERKILDNSLHIIGRTEWDKRITRILAPKSKYYLGNEMMRPIFYEKKWEKENYEEVLNIVTVMGGVLYKGLETVVQTARFLQNTKTINFKWTVVGIDENTPVVIIVKNWLKICYVDLNIDLVGSKNEEELSSLLVNSDIYCQCSHIENSPNSLCEAMLIGLPIIATFAGGTSSLLTNKLEGILVQECDPYSLAGAIFELVNDYEYAKFLGGNARERSIHRHDPYEIVNRLLDIYNTILSDND